MNNKTKAVLAGLIVLLIVIGAMFARRSNGDTSPLKIGWIGPQTGDAAVLGMDSAVAAQLAVDEINKSGGVNGKQVQLYLEDDQYNTRKAIDAYNKLVHVDGVHMLIMQTYGAVFALAKEAQRDGVTIFDSLDCNSKLVELGENVFCLATGSETIGESIAGEINKSGYERVGILYFNSDPFMPYVKEAFTKTYKGAVVEEGYAAGTKDFRTSLLKMKQANVQALVLFGYDETGIAMQEARTLGLTDPFFSTATITSPSLQKMAGTAAIGTKFAYWEGGAKGPVAKSFLKKFTAKVGRKPILDLATYSTYDAVHTIARILSDGSSLTKAAVSTKSFEGATGQVRFAADGSARMRETLYVLTSDGVKKH